MISPKQKFMLFKRTKNFCSAPWNLLFVDTDGGIKTCNKGAVLGNCHNESLNNILKNQHFQIIKTMINQDHISYNCRSCIALENSGAGSHSYEHIRGMYNEMFKNQTIDYTDVTAFQLGAVDLHWSSICDLKCITCWAKQSSSIAHEQQLPVRHTDTKTAYQIIEFIVQNQKNIKEVYLSGGEPSLIKYNLRLLEQLTKSQDLLIRVNSNLMWQTDNEIIQEILKFPKVLFTCSADNVSTKFEYIRRGAKWETFVKNLEFLRQYSTVDLRINLVFFALSALDLHSTIDYFYHKHNIRDFSINQCGMGHTYLQSRNMPEQIKKQVCNSIENIKENHADLLNLIGCLNNCLEEIKLPKQEDYAPYLDGIDSLAGTNWQQIFPELI